MFRLAEFWKIVVIAIAFNVVPPVVGVMNEAHGAAGDFVTYSVPGGSITGVLGVADGVTYIITSDIGNNTQWAFGLFYVRQFSYPYQVTFLNSSEYASLNTGGFPKAELGQNPPMGKINGKSLLLRMIEKGKLWDIDKNGVINAADALKFTTDMDNDGIPNSTDKDDDGDGELDRYEELQPQDNDSLSKWDPTKFIDRDDDKRPDFFDSDGDGYPNWIESWWAATEPSQAPFLEGVTPQATIDPNIHPSSYGWIVDNNPASLNFRGQAVDGYLGPGIAWGDEDGDGIPNWYEFVRGTGISDPAEFPDTNGDGVPDLIFVAGAPVRAPEGTTVNVAPRPPSTVVTGGGTTGGETPPVVPTPPTPTPITPFQMAWPQGGGGGGGASAPAGQSNAGSVITSSNATSNAGAFTGIGSGAAASNPGYGGSFTSPATGGTGGGSGGGTGGGTGEGEGPGNGDYQVVEQPKGQSTAFMGVGGGSWQYRSGNDLGLTAGAEYVHAGLGASGLRNQMGQGPSGVDISHVAVLSMRWIDGTTKTWNVPLLPDLSTPSGQTADKIRIFIRIFAALIAGYVFIGKVWTALRQG